MTPSTGRSALTHPDGSALHKAYDSADTFTNASVTDELGRVTVTSYDAYGQMVRTDRTLAGATVPTRYSYDLLGHLTGIQDAAGNHWSYTYDSLGRKTVASGSRSRHLDLSIRQCRSSARRRPMPWVR